MPEVLRNYCETCYHFKQMNPNGFGECRWPGPGADYSGWANWPRLHSGDWCGQWKAIVTIPASASAAPSEPSNN